MATSRGPAPASRPGRPRLPRTLGLPLAAGLALLLPAGCRRAAGPAGGPPEVVVVAAVERDVPVLQEQVGQTTGFEDVQVRARVEGYLERVAFREGDHVSRGDLLYTIDPKPYEAVVSQRKANVADARAGLEKAEREVARLAPLAEEQAVSRRDYDDAVSSRDAARAQLDAAKAQLDSAELNLGYTRVTAPISGIADLTRVKEGNLVGRGEPTLLTTISAVDPILVTTNVSEADYLAIAKHYVETKGHPEHSGVEMLLANGAVYPTRGRLDAVQRAVDRTSGTLAVRLLFPNPTKLLRPGQYVRVRFAVGRLAKAVCVPKAAVTEFQGVFQVVVVGPDRKADVRAVRLGPASGDLVVVAEGLKAGESVVVEGLQKVKAGSEVVPKAPAPAPPGSAPAPAAPRVAEG